MTVFCGVALTGAFRGRCAGLGFVATFFAVATSGPRVGSSVGVEEPTARDVRVPLCRRDARVPQQFLHSPDVGPSFQKVRSERVPQGVRGDPPPRQQGSAIPLNHRTDIPLTEGLAAPIEEHVPRSLRSHPGPPLAQVHVERVGGILGNRYVTLFRTLPEHEDAARGHVDPVEGEAGDLPDAEAGPVQELERGPVP